MFYRWISKPVTPDWLVLAVARLLLLHALELVLKEFTVKGSVTLCCRGCRKGPNHKLISGAFFSHPFRPFLCFSSLSPTAKWSLRDLGTELPSAGRDNICSYHYQTRTVGSKCVCGMGVFRAQRTCLVAADVVLFLMNEIWKLKQMRSVISECTVCYRVVAY